jgi:hypothetical protein
VPKRNVVSARGLVEEEVGRLKLEVAVARAAPERAMTVSIAVEKASARVEAARRRFHEKGGGPRGRGGVIL